MSKISEAIIRIRMFFNNNIYLLKIYFVIFSLNILNKFKYKKSSFILKTICIDLNCINSSKKRTLTHEQIAFENIKIFCS